MQIQKRSIRYIFAVKDVMEKSRLEYGRYLSCSKYQKMIYRPPSKVSNQGWDDSSNNWWKLSTYGLCSLLHAVWVKWCPTSVFPYSTIASSRMTTSSVAAEAISMIISVSADTYITSKRCRCDNGCSFPFQTYQLWWSSPHHDCLVDLHYGQLVGRPIRKTWKPERLVTSELMPNDWHRVCLV